MPSDAELSPLLLLHPEDNVFVTRRALKKGESIMIEGHEVTIAAAIPLGHKVARRNLSVGAKVLKHGAKIGSTTQPIALGEHVHRHNMKSDYLPSHTRQSLERDANA